MNKDNIYINRTVQIDGQLQHEDFLLGGGQIIIVLAEPGAGKTELLESLSGRLGTKRYRASIFKNKTQFDQTDTLIIDGLDELAKIDQSAIDAIIVKAGELEPKKVVFASRSAQWETARTRTVKDVFGMEPVVARLRPFDMDEQRALFEAYKPDEDFEKFLRSLKKIDVHGLLGNPQMLKTFADAYVQNDGEFSSKQQVFQDAIVQLASEQNSDHIQSGRPPTPDIVTQGDELFCKILVSGCAGASTTEAAQDRDFPYVNGLLASVSEVGAIAIRTGLFRPSDAPDQHEPIHRIIAEYSAARYLVKRIQDSSDRLSLKRVLALIAPNNTPRDELRGLLAWMAAEGAQVVELAVIEIDPYAILSNGDPSRLDAQSKSFLLTQLARLADQNPHFRGGDIWRHFSAAGFFTDDVVEATQAIISEPSTSVQLRHLILELLQDTPAAVALMDELDGLLLNQKIDENSRTLALRNLHRITTYEPVAAYESLHKERSLQSIPLAAELIEQHGVSVVGRENVRDLLLTIDEVFFPKKRTATRSRIEETRSRYFITNLINSFCSEDVVWFLDELSRDLTCDCERDKRYDCFCRRGRSYLIGKLLDRLFELNENRLSAAQLWNWTKELRYEYGKRSQDSTAVAALQNDDSLRREIHRIAFGQLTNEDEIFDVKIGQNMGDGHSGLLFKKEDFQALTDYAFETDNAVLWSCFFTHHRLYEKENFEDPYRAHMRQQALEKPEFGRFWARRERAWRQHSREHRIPTFRHSTRVRRQRRAERQVREDNQRHFDANQQLIESGQHWGWLKLFAEGYLHQNREHFPDMEDEELPVRALCNCFVFLLPSVPSLDKIAETARVYDSVVIAHAACLAHFRTHGNLNGIDKQILGAVLTQANVHYTSGNNDDREEYEAEIGRQIFRSPEATEKYIRQLVEPQIADPTRQHTDVSWLTYREQFRSFRSLLPIEWLERFPEIHLSSMGTLFDLAARFGDRTRLLQVIDNQVKNIGAPPECESEEALKEYNTKRDFWHLRKFFFFDQCEADSAAWLQENKEHALAIYNITGRGYREDNEGWKELSAEKVQIVLDTFINQWPKVHLPSSYGTGDPPEQTAYRFLTEIVWRIGNDEPERAISVLDALIGDSRFEDFLPSLKTQKSQALKKIALRDFAPPLPAALVEMLDNQQVATVEDLRALLIELLEDTQNWIKGAETDPVEQFYNTPKGGDPERVDENTATKRMVDRLHLQCKTLGLATTIEHHLHDGKRSDITLRMNIGGVERLLVTEAKGQWHKELYTAAAEQLDARYSIHPDAVDQGVYLAYWFGPQHEVAGVKNHDIGSSAELRQRIIENMPEELRSRIDVFVLDVSI